MIERGELSQTTCTLVTREVKPDGDEPSEFVFFSFLYHAILPFSQTLRFPFTGILLCHDTARSKRPFTQ